MRKAFTLAEVLITLGIIGVVAALTIPALVNSTQKKELAVNLKKQYSLIQQVFQLYEADNGVPLAYKFFPFVTYEEYYNEGRVGFMQYFDVLRENINIPNDMYNNFNNVASHHVVAPFDDGNFTTKDGTLFIFNNDGYGALISVDTNGPSKKPNRWGYDLFSFEMVDGKLLPGGADGTRYSDKATYCSPNSSEAWNGIACTYYALTDDNYWKNLP
jgi:prepilin-type N-terminal cleavage/methylation domain-containing protein